MKKFYFLFLLAVYALSSAQNLDWYYDVTQDEKVHPGNFHNSNRVYSIAIDSKQNVYMIGVYQHNLGLDPSNPTLLQLVDKIETGSNECYLVKVDKNRNYLWHKTISVGGSSGAALHSIAIDKDDNVIVAGSTRGNSINLNPGDPAQPIYNTDNFLQNAIFLNKYSKDGDFIFGNFYKGGSGFPKVTIDKDSNIFLAGQYGNYFAGYNTDFDLSSQVFYLSGREGSSFILKNDSGGHFINAKFLEGVMISAIKFDNSNDLIISGNGANINYNNESNFINQLNGSGSGDYLLKISNNLVPIWFQAIGGREIYSTLNDSRPFDIDSDNSIVVSTTRPPLPVNFPNYVLPLSKPLVRNVLFKLTEGGKYVWHSTIEQSAYSQTFFPIAVTIASDHTINWSNEIPGISFFDAVGENTEIVSSTFFGSDGSYNTLLKLNTNGKLIYNKSKIVDHTVARTDNINDKMYFGGQDYGGDPNPDIMVNQPVPYIPGMQRLGYVQKLDKCYSGTSDGDPFFYTCVSEMKKIKDLYPKTSYSSWYDSPTSTTALSPETILQTKKYYAETQDVSCPKNSTRLEVDVRVFQNPPKLVVPDFTFCNLQGKRLLDLNINNNQNIEFFDENLVPKYLGTIIEANKKYYVLQGKSYSNYAYCRSELTEFYVYDTSVAPIVPNNQTFCKINSPKISDLVASGINLKWYDVAGNSIPTTTLLQDQTKYFVTQTSGTYESGKAEITVKIDDPNPPSGSAVQDFCSAQNPSLANIQVSGTNIKWYDQNGVLVPLNTTLVDGLTYFASQTINNCESTQRFAVKTNVNSNSLPANDYAEIFCDENTDDVKSIDLDNYRSKLIADYQNYTFDYYDSNNLQINSNITINLGVTEYNIKITSTLGCYKWVKLSFTLHPKPKLDLPSVLEFCEGQSVILDAGNGYKSYLWNTGEKTQTISTKQEGTYSVTVTNSFDCINTGTIVVKKSISANIKNILIVNNDATVIMSEPGDYLFSLDNISFQTSNTFSNLKNGNYTVYVKTNAGCIIGVQNFTIFSVPNSFTPNADGINDSWMISGLENYVNSEIITVDKTGREVLKTLINGQFQWDGKLLGRPLPTDTYWYLIKVSDGRVLQGSVLLKNRN